MPDGRGWDGGLRLAEPQALDIQLVSQNFFPDFLTI